MAAGIEIINALGIIFAFFIFAYIFCIFLKRHASKVTKLTKTTLDDEILAVVEKSIPIGIILAGFYFGLASMRFFSQYSFYLGRFFTIIIVLLFAFIIVKIVNIVIKWYSEHIPLKNKPMLEQFFPIFRTVINLFIYTIAFIIIADKLDFEISPFIATLGMGGITVAMALQESLTNFFAGFYISVDRPLKVGEFVKLESKEEGFIDGIGWRSSKVRLPSNNIIVVPNSRLAQSIIINYDRPTRDMELDIIVGVDYKNDLEKVERATIEVARDVLANTPGGVKDFQPFIRFKEFGDSNIMFSVILRIKTAIDKPLITHEFIKALKKRYDSEGIEISCTFRKDI